MIVVAMFSACAPTEPHPDALRNADGSQLYADGTYRIVVGGVDRGELVVTLGMGETEFRSPVEAGKVLLDNQEYKKLLGDLKRQEPAGVLLRALAEQAELSLDAVRAEGRHGRPVRWPPPVSGGHRSR